MLKRWLQCVRCCSRFDVAPLFHGCPNCKALGHVSPIEVQYDFSALRGAAASDGAESILSELMPDLEGWEWVALGEGKTPLVPVRCGSRIALLKNETQNPTWSWKDRPNAVSVSMARRFEFKRVAAWSTGNHGSALAAYAAAAGLQATVVHGDRVPELQLALMTAYGAELLKARRGNDPLAELVSTGEYFPCSILCPRAGYSNPFGIEGFKQIAFEIWRQMGHQAPERVFVPVGSGDGIYGIWKGFRELLALGLIDKAPRMIACQPDGAASAYRAYRRGDRSVQPLEHVVTLALSLGERITGDHALRAIRESHGEALTVSDDHAIIVARKIARQGFALEISSAVAFACAERAAELDSDGRGAWVVIGSGSAVKWPTALISEISGLAVAPATG